MEPLWLILSLTRPASVIVDPRSPKWMVRDELGYFEDNAHLIMDIDVYYVPDLNRIH